MNKKEELYAIAGSAAVLIAVFSIIGPHSTLTATVPDAYASTTPAISVQQAPAAVPPQEKKIQPPVQSRPASNLRDVLSIPKIGVSAKAVPMGIDEDGRMAVPNNFTEVAWFSEGAYPGETGTAVIGAHVDNGGSVPGVFKHLKALSPGDIITFINNKGERIQFRVTATQIYDRNATDVSHVFNSNDGKAHLNLITCTGTWLPKLNTYADRLVVFTERVD